MALKRVHEVPFPLGPYFQGIVSTRTNQKVSGWVESNRVHSSRVRIVVLYKRVGSSIPDLNGLVQTTAGKADI